MTAVAGIPQIRGALDSAYLQQALARAGRASDVRMLDRAPLSGGRQNFDVSSVEVETGTGARTSYVLKPSKRKNWRTVGAGAPGESELWLAGVTRSLPAPLQCPTFDVAHHVERDEWWMLMDDVSRGIVGRGVFGQEHTRRLLRAIAPLHARYWDREEELGRMPIGSLEAMTGIFAEPTLLAARGGEARAPWIREAVDHVWVIRQFVPVFLELLSPADADFYLDLCANRERWLAALAGVPNTLVHGDLRRANMAFLEDVVSVFDWDLATRGPAAADLQWHWFLSFWAYPPADGRSVADREPLRLEYVSCLETALGSRIDREAFDRSWDLCWLRVLVQIGCVLADPVVTPKPSPEAVAATRKVCSEAIALARSIHDRQVR